MSKVFDIAFKLGAELTSSFNSAFQKANSNMDMLAKAGKNMTSSGKMLTSTVTAPILGIGAAAFKAAVDYESAFAGIRKTTDMTEKEYSEMSQSIRNMSKEIPASAVAIAEIGEAAGQLGIQKENILGFSRTMIDLSEATNMTADVAATSFAQFANVVGMPQENFDRLGSSVVALGNTMATTEADIVQMAMRLSGTGAQVGLTEAQIMALSATMSSVGINAEAGGSAMSTVMKKIQNAVADGGKDMDAFAKAAGLSSASFSDAWKNDPITALDAFIKGLSESGESGENLNAILGNLGIKGIQETDTLLRLAGASDLLSGAVDTSTIAWEENTALAEEAAQRYETTAAQLKIMWNRVTDLGITIGNILIPKVIDLLDKISPWIERFSNLSVESQNLIIMVAGIAAAIGPLLLVTGTLITSFTTTVGAIRKVRGAFIALTAVQKLSMGIMRLYRVAMLTYSIQGGGVAGVTAVMTGAFSALNAVILANPIVFIVAAIVALGIAFVLAYKHSEKFRAVVDASFSKVKEVVMSTVEYVKTVGPKMWNGMVEGVKGIGDRISGFLGAELNSGVGKIIGGFIDSFKSGMSSLPGIISMALPTIATIGLSFLGVTGPIGWVIGAVLSLVGFLFRLSKSNEGVADAMSGAWSAIQKAVEPIIEVFNEGFSQFVEEVGPELTKTIEVISDSVVELIPAFVEIGTTLAELGAFTLTSLGDVFLELVPVVMNIAQTVIPLILEVVQTVFPIILEVISTIIPIVVQVLTSIIPIILTLVQTIIPLILSVVQMVFPIILEIIQTVLPVFANLITIVIGVILTLVQAVIPLILTVIQAVLPVVLGIVQSIIPIIAVVFQILIGVINSVLIPAINAILTVVQIVFPYVQMVIENTLAIINGIIQTAMALLQGDWSGAWEAIKTTATTIMDNIIGFFKGINLYEVGKSIITGLIDGIKSMGSAVIGAISGMIPEPIRGVASKLLGSIPGFAKGGIVTSPTLAWVGEGGDTETVIPWNNSQRSRDLWTQTGQQLGMLGKSESMQQSKAQGKENPLAVTPQQFSSAKTSSQSSVSIQVSNAPVYHIDGGNPQEVQQVVERGNDDLLSRIKELKKDEGRLAFG